MKYLVTLEPSEEFTHAMKVYRNILGPNLKVPRVGDHCTLMFTHCDENNQDTIIDALSQIEHNAFDVTLGEVVDFGGHTLVALVNKTDTLQQLHYKVIGAIEPYVDHSTIPAYQGNDAAASVRHQKYGSEFAGDVYQPHLTAGRGVNILQKDFFKGIVLSFDSFTLSRKEASYVPIAQFELRKS